MRAARKSDVAEFDHDDQVAKLEILVDELIRSSPREDRIQSYMQAAKLPYSADPVTRMTTVLGALDKIRGGKREKMGEA